MSKEGASPEQRARYKTALSKALEAGYAVLKEGGEAMDAAVAAVSSMEGKSADIDDRVHQANSRIQIARSSMRGKALYSMWRARWDFVTLMFHRG